MKRQFLFSLLTMVAVMAHGLWQASAVQSQQVTIKIKPGAQVTEDDQDKTTKSPFTGVRPAVDVAILLDTSNSMDGLINQAKSQLWNIIQQFAKAEKQGQTPSLRVAVFEYGNTNLPATEGYIRQVAQLTDDMDQVSEALFSLTTRGGDEYCGQVIHEALERLDWSTEPGAYKAIFIAGNEPFTQGSVDYQTTCRSAIQRGVVVNTIHCGNRETGIQGKWQHGAQLAEGEFMNINQDEKVVHIKAPQDQIIIQLNKDLNKTYLWFGAKDKRAYYRDNQALQDRNALQQSGGAGFGGGRGVTKASKLYSNRGRDLVDTFCEKPEDLAKVKKAELPEVMQKMTLEQQQAYLKKVSAEREAIKKKILTASAERAKYVAAKRKEMAEGQEDQTLGSAINSAVRSQLMKSGFKVKK